MTMSDRDDIFSTFIQLLLSHIAIQMFYHGILQIFARSAQRGIYWKQLNEPQNDKYNTEHITKFQHYIKQRTKSTQRHSQLQGEC